MPKEWRDITRFEQSCFIIGSGPSIDSYSKRFFEEIFKLGTVIGVNNVAMDFPCHFNVRKSFGKEREVPRIIPEYNFVNPDCKVIISEHDCGTISTEELRNTNTEGEYYYFHHQDNLINKGINWPETGEIIVSWSTMTSAMHLAASLGSQIIFLIGHDLRGQNYSKYPSAAGPRYSKFRRQSLEVKSYLENKYDCTIISLSPFIGLGSLK